jgi:predicted Rossmann fold nucleotide-binding protein DprA/Smf involved in DNA uptake
VGIDEMAFELQIDSSNLSLQLLEMEFKGVIRTLPGKQYELV